MGRSERGIVKTAESVQRFSVSHPCGRRIVGYASLNEGETVLRFPNRSDVKSMISSLAPVAVGIDALVAMARSFPDPGCYAQPFLQASNKVRYLGSLGARVGMCFVQHQSDDPVVVTFQPSLGGLEHRLSIGLITMYSNME